MKTSQRIIQLVFGTPGRLVLGISISALTIYLSFRSVSLEDILNILAQIKWQWIAISLLAVGVNHLAKTLRWKRLIDSSGMKIPFMIVLAEMMAGQMWNLILPARLGDLTRIQRIGVAGPGRSFVLGTIVIEKTVDMLAYAFLFILLVVSLPLPEWIQGTGIVLTVSAVIFLGLLLLITKNQTLVQKIFFRFSDRLPLRISTFLKERYQSMLRGLSGLQEKQSFLPTIFWTILVWTSSILINQFVLYSFGLFLDIKASILLLLGLQAGISIPSMPARVGVFEFICILSLGVFGIERDLALSYGIVLHILVMAPILISGVIFFSRSGMRKENQLI